MASGINIYSQLLISTIRIVDIDNSNCRYQHFTFKPHSSMFVINSLCACLGNESNDRQKRKHCRIPRYLTVIWWILRLD